MVGPNGEKRPSDTIGCAVMVARIATREAVDVLPSGRKRSGEAGAKARADSLTPAQRLEIAKKAADKRWSKVLV